MSFSKHQDALVSIVEATSKALDSHGKGSRTPEQVTALKAAAQAKRDRKSKLRSKDVSVVAPDGQLPLIFVKADRGPEPVVNKDTIGRGLTVPILHVY